MRKSNLIRIGIADDHPLVRRGLIEYINSFLGIEVVVEADDGLQLIQEMQSAKHLPNICIVDVFMPAMNGLTTLIKIKEAWPDVKVLAMTGYNVEYYLPKLLRNGASGLIQKACKPAELETAIRAIFNDGFYSPNLDFTKYYRAVMNNELKLPEFTEMEIAVMKLCCSDLTYAGIARELNTTPRSVDWYRNSLFKKLKINSRSTLVMFAIQFGLVELVINPTQFDLIPTRP